MHVLRNNEARSRKHCSHGKTEILHILTVSLALVIQHAKGMHRIISSPVARMTTIIFQPISLYQNFRNYLRNCAIFGNNLLNMKCAFRFSVRLLSETFLILRRIRRDINLHRSSCKVSLNLVRF
jgi:hypothetical protein